MIYLEFITGSICHYTDPVFGSTGSGVHAERKYGLNEIFLQNTASNRIQILQFSGLRLVTFFATSFISQEGAKGRRTPAVTRQRDHVGEFGGWGGFRFLPSKKNEVGFFDHKSSFESSSEFE